VFAELINCNKKKRGKEKEKKKKTFFYSRSIYSSHSGLYLNKCRGDCYTYIRPCFNLNCIIMYSSVRYVKADVRSAENFHFCNWNLNANSTRSLAIIHQA
jgi:hypothetical protein